jgi:hypothetical protein
MNRYLSVAQIRAHLRNTITLALGITLLACMLPQPGQSNQAASKQKYYWRNRDDPAKDGSKDAYECEALARQIVATKYGTALTREIEWPKEQARCMDSRGYDKRLLKY